MPRHVPRHVVVLTALRVRDNHLATFTVFDPARGALGRRTDAFTLCGKATKPMIKIGPAPREFPVICDECRRARDES